MSDTEPTIRHEQAHTGSRETQLVPIFLLCALAIGVVLYFAWGKSDQTLSGVVIMDLPVYKFYPEQKDCSERGTPYLLIPNSRFEEIAKNTAPIDDLDALLHASWRVKLRGNLSRLGRYGPRGIYWREFEVQYVIDAVPLNCKPSVLISKR